MASDAPPLPSSFIFPVKHENDAVSHPNPMININNLDFNPDEDDEIDVDDDVTLAVPMHVQPISTAVTASKKMSPYPIDESRKLFQRLWTDEDEIELLQGFLDYNNQKGSINQHHHDTSVFYDQVKTKFQLDFNKNQLVEKLRRLKKKFRNVMQKIESGKEYAFKSPHDQATFEISKKIWGGGGGGTVITNTNFNTTPIKISHEEGGINDEDDDPSPNSNLNFGSGLIDFSPNLTAVDEKIQIRAKKRPRVAGGGGVGNVGGQQLNQPQTPISVGVSDQTGQVVATPNVIEETIRSCLSPLFKELLNGVMNLSNGGRGVGGLTGLATMPFGLGFGAISGGGGVDLAAAGDEKWRNQQILELEVFSKRLELVQDQIKVQLEELRGKGS